MALKEKNQKRFLDENYKTVLNENDPFDRLILHLATTGVLDVAVISLHHQKKQQHSHDYSRRPLLRHGKHTS